MGSIKNLVKNSYRKIYKQLMFNLSAANNPIYLGFYKKFYRPRKGTIAEFADAFSRNNPRLTVVQIGANDGFNHDPIHKFIKRDKWRGVLLEPQKEVYEEFLEKLHKRSPEVHTINAAIDYKDGSRPIYKVSFSNARWATGLTSFDRPTLQKAVASEHVLSCADREGVEIPDNPEDRIKEEKINTISPQTLLQRYKIEQIDWLQIDVEGFDYEVIKMFDVAKTQPRVIVFEQYNLSAEERQECYAHLRSNSYRVKEYGRDALAVLEPEEEYLRFL